MSDYADGGESTQTFLDRPELFDTLETHIHRGDLALIQLAHNDKTTTLTALTGELVEGLGVTASRDLSLTNVNGDNAHTSVHGARTFAGPVVADLESQDLVHARVAR
ncbi:SGNH/GDSL hydrolase family protein [Streptomyces litchfieldiae]|uniref:Uncharacterized protein n=1 Tax=Streptomyces litchfieldiae TaxID=3075543 RepID=A0ABU2MRG1_9ACTN|nr:hypothetical protein [Streptomyces sp. DSM 44938]MDT0343679.1 hypothetical protein [Streptomyces sp. DSM 44938]